MDKPSSHMQGHASSTHHESRPSQHSLDAHLSKADSAVLYGAAILLMVFHHLFCMPERLNGNYISVFGPFQQIEVQLAWTSNICVGIYSFISGYAMCHAVFHSGFLRSVTYSLKQGWKLYSRVLLVFCIFAPVAILMIHYELNFRRALNAILLGRWFNGEWWYIKQYLIYLCCLPFLEFVLASLEKDFKKALAVAAILAAFFLTIRFFIWKSAAKQLISYGIRLSDNHHLWIFLEAYLISRYRVFDRIKSRIPSRLVISVPFSVFGIFCSLLVRFFTVGTPVSPAADLLLVPHFIFFAGNLMHSWSNQHSFIRCLSFFGRYSTFVWLVHTFYLYYYFQKYMLWPRLSVLIYFWTVLVSVLSAMLLDLIHRKLSAFLTFVTRKIFRLHCKEDV